MDLYKREYSEEEIVQLAKKRIKVKRELTSHIVAYVFVNAFLFFLNYVNEDFTFSFKGMSWNFWILAGWGLGLAFHISETIQELKFKYNANTINREIAKIKKHIDDVDK